MRGEPADQGFGGFGQWLQQAGIDSARPPALSGRQQSFGVLPGFDARLILGLVDRGDSLAEGVALGDVALGGFYRADAAPLLSGFGCDLAHFVAGMTAAAVVAVNGFFS
jgi:hypothetical protein